MTIITLQSIHDCKGLLFKSTSNLRFRRCGIIRRTSFVHSSRCAIRRHRLCRLLPRSHRHFLLMFVFALSTGIGQVIGPQGAKQQRVGRQKMPYAVGVIETGQYAFLIQISVGRRGFALIRRFHDDEKIPRGPP